MPHRHTLSDTDSDDDLDPLTSTMSQHLSQPGDNDDSMSSQDEPRLVDGSSLRPIPSQSAAIRPIGMVPLDPSGAQLLDRGGPVRISPDTAGLPFSNVEELEDYLRSNDLSEMAPDYLKRALTLIHHHLVGIPVKDISFDKLLDMFYLQYQYSGGRLEVANCSNVRDLDAVRGNLFIYGGHIVNSLEIAMISSSDREFAINRTTLRFMDSDLNLQFAELYTRLELYNHIVPSMYRAAIPNAASSDALEEQRASYAEGLQMYQYMETPPKPNVFLSFFTMYMVVKLQLRLYDGRLYEQVKQPKYTVVMLNGDYVCAHKSPHCPTCHLGLKGHRRSVIGHVFEPKIEKVAGEKVNTRSWKPFTSKGKKKILGYTLRVKNGSVTDFITAICSSTVNRFAAKLIMEMPGLVKGVAEYIKMAKEPMLPPLEPYSRAWSFYNGILVDTDFYSYDDLPVKYENLSTVRLYSTWHFDEAISTRLKGHRIAGMQAPIDVLRMPRDLEFQFEGYVQNLYCKKCHRSKYTANHDKCCEEDELDMLDLGEVPGYGPSSSSSSGHQLPTTSSRWELHCANHGCYQVPTACTCDKSKFYIQNPTQFMKIETTFFDRTILPQIKAAVMASPTGRRYLNTEEQSDVYVTILAMLGRTFHKIGEAAVRENKERIARGEPPIPTDNLNACLAMVGKAGTGKSTISKILESALKEFGVLDNNASREFWGAQLLNDENEFKPIISSEITSDFWPRERFCKAVANEPLVVKQKNINDDVVATPEYQLTLFGNKWELEEVEGSVARRVLIFLFTKRLNPNDIDSQLFSRILMDMGSWIVKALLAYRYFVEKISNNGMWSAHGVPQYFHYTKDIIEIRNNAHLSFLREGFGPNGEFLFHPDAYISEGTYIEAFQHFTKRKGATFPEWTPEVWESQFEDFGLCYAPKGGMMDKQGEALTDDRYIRGIGYVADFPELVQEANTMAQDARGIGSSTGVPVGSGSEGPEIQTLRQTMDTIAQKGLTIPMDLLQTMRALL